MNPAIRQTADWKKNTPLIVRIYGEKDGTFELYDDDGTTFDYQLGKYSIKLLKSNQRVGKIEDLKSDGPWTYGDISWKFMSSDY